MSVDETTAKKISTEARKVIAHHVNCTREWALPQWYFSWTRLVRVTAYILRFIRHSKRKKNSQPGGKSPIEVSELREAARRWCRLVQKAHFSKEWSALNKNEPIPPSSALKALRPMLRDSIRYSALTDGCITPPLNTVKNIRLYCRSTAYLSFS
jgi:hypothetical protein